MKKCLLVTLLISLALCCVACAALPVEERSYTVVLCVDRDGTAWKTFARVPTYQTGGGYMTLEGEGGTFHEALSALEEAAPMRLHMGQIRLLIFTLPLAESADFPAVLAELGHRPDIRMEAALAVTAAVPDALMEALTPATGSRLSKSLDVLLETRLAQGVVFPATLKEVLRMGQRQSPVLLCADVADQQLTLSGGYLVGQDGAVHGQLDSSETQLLSLLAGRMTESTLSLAEGTATLLETSARCTLSGQNVRCDITLRYGSSTLTKEALAQATATAMQGVLGKLTAAGCDALGLGRQAMLGIADEQTWQRLDWKSRFSSLEWHVNVNARPAA